MPSPLTGVLGRKLINFVKHSSMSRNSTVEDPMEKLIILAIQEGVISVHKDVPHQAVSNMESVSISM